MPWIAMITYEELAGLLEYSTSMPHRPPPRPRADDDNQAASDDVSSDHEADNAYDGSYGE